MSVAMLDITNKDTTEWIKTKLTGEAEVKKHKIQENIQFHLGGGETVKLETVDQVKEAVNKIYNRDYLKYQNGTCPKIIVPPRFLSSKDLMKQCGDETEFKKCLENPLWNEQGRRKGF